MRKIDLSGRLSKKNTLIAVVCIVLFVVIGFIAAVAGHRAYVNSREAKITNISYSTSAKFFMREDGLNLVYKYSPSDGEVDLSEILSLSDGATFRIGAVLDKDGNRIDHTSVVFDVSDSDRYFVIINVKSLGGVHSNGYIVEIVSEDDFDPESPSLVIPENIKEYISAA